MEAESSNYWNISRDCFSILNACTWYRLNPLNTMKKGQSTWLFVVNWLPEWVWGLKLDSCAVWIDRRSHWLRTYKNIKEIDKSPVNVWQQPYSMSQPLPCCSVKQKNIARVHTRLFLCENEILSLPFFKMRFIHSMNIRITSTTERLFSIPEGSLPF